MVAKLCWCFRQYGPVYAWKSIYDGNELLACFIKSVAPSEGRWDVCVRVIGEAVLLIVPG